MVFGWSEPAALLPWGVVKILQIRNPFLLFLGMGVFMPTQVYGHWRIEEKICRSYDILPPPDQNQTMKLNRSNNKHVWNLTKDINIWKAKFREHSEHTPMSGSDNPFSCRKAIEHMLPDIYMNTFLKKSYNQKILEADWKAAIAASVVKLGYCNGQHTQFYSLCRVNQL